MAFPEKAAPQTVHQATYDKVVALAGNPNVGKSTVFNALTGMHQHTGNWPGKTVASAQGRCHTQSYSYLLVDLPGTYSLMAHSAEEEVARDFLCFAYPDAAVVVCDATCLERNLNLVLQTIELCPRVVVCVNLLDEARRKHITIDLSLLQQRLGVPVVGITARKPQTLAPFLTALDDLAAGHFLPKPCEISYTPVLEQAIALLMPAVMQANAHTLPPRWLSLQLLLGEDSVIQKIRYSLGVHFLENQALQEALAAAKALLAQHQLTKERLQDEIVTALVNTAEHVCEGAVQYGAKNYNAFDRRLDRLLTSKRTGYPVMILLLALVFWLTVSGANIPSQLLADGLFWVQDRLTDLFVYLHAPAWLHGILVLGVYRVLAWVVSVMLPPMAIFFPLFTLLEDAGYLPRVAYNLDKPFQKCCACGKQALCMCMGFGCNAAGVVGARIIDSPRERLLAVLTNSFVPCNGRFPTLIALITMFFIGTASGVGTSILSALLLTGVIVLGVAVTFAVTRILSKTVLKGVPSSFALELPPYRRPQLGKVIVRSICDRTLFVLGRAVVVAAPAGMVLWLLANIMIGGQSVLAHCAAFLNPFAAYMGLDGVILLAFILGFPANEIVVPIILMAYLAQGSLLELESVAQMKEVFIANGWTWITAVSTMLFCMFHWPCSTTLLTIRKETGSWKWTLLAALLPTAVGIGVCMLFTFVANCFI